MAANPIREGNIRIPSGCAISGMFAKDGRLVSGESIVHSMTVMHDRSNGLGGGFAGYGIYPEYKDAYAFHVFYDNKSAKQECEEFLEEHFDIINLLKKCHRLKHSSKNLASQRSMLFVFSNLFAL